MTEFPLLSAESLASRTTLAVGGPARFLVEAERPEVVAAALAWGRAESLDVLILGGGSNLLVSDAGFDGLVISPTDTTLKELERSDSEILIEVGAGYDWDALVALCVERGWSGLECLSGIPGRVGAAPIQNIGAYGQEVAECIEAVHVMRRADGGCERLVASACDFGYRHSHFKTRWRDTYVVLSVEFRLKLHGPAPLRYGELTRHLGAESGHSLVAIREAVLALRAGKSMVYDQADPNHRSAGSFFVNPVVRVTEVEDIVDRFEQRGIDGRSMPRYPVVGGSTQQVKLSAAWLIEQSGFTKGLVDGQAGLSTRHCLALINRGDASASELVALARRIRDGVEEACGVRLVPEPAMVGLSIDDR